MTLNSALWAKRAQKPAQPCKSQHMTMATLGATSAEEAFSSFQGCSWDDVLASMEQAVANDETKADRSRARALLRNRPVIVTLQTLTNMIPDQDGLSVMRGGLKYIFDVSKANSSLLSRLILFFLDSLHVAPAEAPNSQQPGCHERGLWKSKPNTDAPTTMHKPREYTSGF